MKTLENLNNQFNLELQASHMYLQMSVWCAINNYKGFSSFFNKESDSEREHANKVKYYAIDVIGASKDGYLSSGELQEIKSFDNLMGILQESLLAEQVVTASIKKNIDAAIADQDYATVDFFYPMIQEQVKSEAEINYIIDKAEACAGNYAAIMMLDEEVNE